jgi:APA family basic amino acid/polyamine antiporter
MGSWITGFGVSLIAVAWAFDGWNNINWVAGEIKRPKRNLPLALILGTVGITALYILANILYLYALPIGEIVGVVRIAEKATTALFGGPTGRILAVLVVISTFSSMNGSILTGPRVYYAMAKDALFFRRMAVVNRRFRTPGYAILIQGIWCCLLAVSGTFEQLITFAMFISIGFWIAATASVFTLRKKMPDLPRPYRTWGYPVVPAVFILASVGILVNTLIEKPVEALAGVLITLLGVPVYLFWRSKAGPRARST